MPLFYVFLYPPNQLQVYVCNQTEQIEMLILTRQIKFRLYWTLRIDTAQMENHFCLSIIFGMEMSCILRIHMPYVHTNAIVSFFTYLFYFVSLSLSLSHLLCHTIHFMGQIRLYILRNVPLSRIKECIKYMISFPFSFAAIHKVNVMILKCVKGDESNTFQMNGRRKRNKKRINAAQQQALPFLQYYHRIVKG